MWCFRGLRYNSKLSLVISFVLITAVYYHSSSDRLKQQLQPKDSGLVRVQRWTNSVLPDNERIFFHETTGSRLLNLRQLCAVESAAKENPYKSIQLFLQNPNPTDNITIDPLIHRVLSHYSNVVVVFVNVSDYFANTPLESWYKTEEWTRSPYRTEHFSDYIRILSLYKGGGMYMDLDFVTLRSFDSSLFWNFVPKEDESRVTGSAIHFEYNHPILARMMTFLASSYHPDQWIYSGPGMVQRTVLRYCAKRSLPNFEGRYHQLCPGIKVLSRSLLYAYPYEHWKMYFVDHSPHQRSGLKRLMRPLKNSFAIHIYNKLSISEPVFIGSNQLYSIAARQHCPKSYAESEDYF